MEPKRYILRGPRNLRQHGESEPRYIAASPQFPVVVLLDPATVRDEDPSLKPADKDDGESQKLKPANLPKKHDGVKKAADRGKVEQPSEGRAADK